VALLGRVEINESCEAEVVAEEPESEGKVILVKRKKVFIPYYPNQTVNLRHVASVDR